MLEFATLVAIPTFLLTFLAAIPWRASEEKAHKRWLGFRVAVALLCSASILFGSFLKDRAAEVNRNAADRQSLAILSAATKARDGVEEQVRVLGEQQKALRAVDGNLREALADTKKTSERLAATARLIVLLHKEELSLATSDALLKSYEADQSKLDWQLDGFSIGFEAAIDRWLLKCERLIQTIPVADPQEVEAAVPILQGNVTEVLKQVDKAIDNPALDEASATEHGQIRTGLMELSDALQNVSGPSDLRECASRFSDLLFGLKASVANHFRKQRLIVLESRTEAYDWWVERAKKLQDEFPDF